MVEMEKMDNHSHCCLRGPCRVLHVLRLLRYASASISMPPWSLINFAGALRELEVGLGASTELITAGISLFVLGFALGPLLWAPLSEIYGRQIIFFISYGAFTAFCAGCPGANDIGTLLVLRFLAGMFGSSPLTNAGGVIADMFPAVRSALRPEKDSTDCGQARTRSSHVILCPLPIHGSIGLCYPHLRCRSVRLIETQLGPFSAGFLAENQGWRWVMGLMAIFAGVMFITGVVFVPETYGPVILRKRADKLSKMTGREYTVEADREKGRPSLKKLLPTALIRPWILLFKEPIVLLLSIYIAILYGPSQIEW
jgi:MFS family permease